MRGILLGLVSLVAICNHSRAAMPDRTDAFDQAYAESFFDFDACGDGLSGRIYRQALSDRLMHCPFSDEAKARFRVRAALQRRKSADMIRELIEQTGGMPVRLEGMKRTCREQMDSPEYQTVRSRLEAYAAGKASSNDVVPWPCDAERITPDLPSSADR